ncbi:MAG: recombinase family protein [Peptococcaceae bacterium]|nr:MAG: recombinase family protein [Peptococcaceae bacterium]
MKTAFAYARVSTKDQEKQGNSIPEQLLRIEDFAKRQNIKILKVYQDTSSAYHDENRKQFNQMIADALKDRPAYIVVDDSSRFARTREVSASTKKLLRKYGIDILLANEDNVNPKTSAGLWLEGIREIKNEAFSLDISYNVMRGMSGNIKNRDPETGWCYKNGGRSPYGYIITHLNRGTNSKGKPIIKSIWELHPEHAKIAKIIIVDLYTKEEMSYQKIRNYLNNNNITGPEGKPWGISTIVEMLRDNRLQQYAGIAFWNKENRQTVGTRFKPREEWIQVDNAHPAIITQEELEQALQRKTRARKNATIGRTNESPYLFTGKNCCFSPNLTAHFSPTMAVEV